MQIGVEKRLPFSAEICRVAISRCSMMIPLSYFPEIIITNGRTVLLWGPSIISDKNIKRPSDQRRKRDNHLDIPVFSNPTILQLLNNLCLNLRAPFVLAKRAGRHCRPAAFSLNRIYQYYELLYDSILDCSTNNYDPFLK